MPPRAPKSRSGLIIGLVLGLVVLLGLAGAGLWFLVGGGGAPKHEFPDGYTTVVSPKAPGAQYTMKKTDDYDVCAELELEAVAKVLPLDGDPKGDTKPNGDGTGTVSCGGSMRSEIAYENTRPSGTFQLSFQYHADQVAAEEVHGRAWSSLADYYKAIDPVTLANTQTEARFKQRAGVMDVAIPFRFGSVTGVATINIDHGDNHDAPDPRMLSLVLVDLVNSGMNALAKG